MRRLLITICSTLAALTACSDTYDYNLADTAGADEGASDTASFYNDEDSASEALSAPYWFVLSGELVVLEGALTEASLNVIIYPEDTESPPICVLSLPDMSVSPEEATPDASIFAWSIALATLSEGECESEVTLPDTILLGLGQLHPDLMPALIAAGLDSSLLYGVYAALGDQDGCAEDSGDACVFGYAMDLNDSKGELPVTEKPPMPDSTYLFEGVYGFRL